jgi:hypothetical protein
MKKVLDLWIFDLSVVLIVYVILPNITNGMVQCLPAMRNNKQLLLYFISTKNYINMQRNIVEKRDLGICPKRHYW